MEGWNEKEGGRNGENRKTRGGLEGFREVICLAACAQPPPQ